LRLSAEARTLPAAKQFPGWWLHRFTGLRGLPIVVLSSRTSQGARTRALPPRQAVLPKSRHGRSPA
jgi:hypothetical protein